MDLPEPENAGDADEHAHGDLDVQSVEVVDPCAAYDQLLFQGFAPPGGNWNGELPTQIAAGQRVGVSLHILHRACCEYPATQLSRTGTEVDQPVRGANHVGIVFHHQDGVSQVS